MTRSKKSMKGQPRKAAPPEEADWEDVEEDKGPANEQNSMRDDILDLSSKSTALFMTLCSHPQFNKAAPDKSPKQLWFVADFVRRTCIEYIAPLCPAMTASGPSKEWPKFNREKWTDCLTRSILIESIILDEDKQIMCEGKFDFGPAVRDCARFLKGTPQAEDLEMLKGKSPEEVDALRIKK